MSPREEGATAFLMGFELSLQGYAIPKAPEEAMTVKISLEHTSPLPWCCSISDLHINAEATRGTFWVCPG